ncbi:MAG: tetratricopeptide repeat protein [Motiliproteus sp.]
MEMKIKNALSKVKQKKYMEAQKIYKKLLKINPRHLDANYLLGTLYAERKMFSEAEHFLNIALKIEPKSERIATNIANIHKLKGNHSLAKKYFKKALLINSNLAEANLGLGTTLEALKEDPNVAMEYYQKAISIEPRMSEGHLCIGNLLAKENDPDAIEYFNSALQFNPKLKYLYKNIGILYLKIDNRIMAVENLTLAKEHIPDDIEIDYFLCIAKGEEPDSRIKHGYIQNEFDGFAKTFDNKLVNQLGYDLPNKAYNVLSNYFGSDFYFPSIVDLGCGTGLNGPLYQPHTSQLIGIDLSEKMLNEAKNRECYSKLYKGEISKALGSNEGIYDLYIATDVFIYLGGLEELFSTIIKKSAPDSYLVFSTESCEEDGFILQKTGRYAHSKKYISELSDKFKCSIEVCERTVIRKESKKNIAGDIFLIRLPKCDGELEGLAK